LIIVISPLKLLNGIGCLQSERQVSNIKLLLKSIRLILLVVILLLSMTESAW